MTTNYVVAEGVMKRKPTVEEAELFFGTLLPELITHFTSGGLNPPEFNDTIKMVRNGAIITASKEGEDHASDRATLRFCDLLESEEAEVTDPNTRLRAIPVQSLEIRTAIRNSLLHANINFVGQIIDATDRDLLRIKNFGKKSLMELRAVISRL